MADQIDIEWPTCDEDGCIGVRLAATPRCLAHARDEQRNLALKQLGETGEIDARGVPITQALLEQILSAAPRDAEDRPTFTAARFERVTFKGDAVFGEAVFQGDARFLGVTIQGRARFEGATFQDTASFVGVTFQGNTGFGGVTFQGGAQFSGVIFKGPTWFHWTIFKDPAWFEGATFKDLI
jgi:uncharacterized protein YjbI with pentapeptide repeats